MAGVVWVRPESHELVFLWNMEILGKVKLK